MGDGASGSSGSAGERRVDEEAQFEAWLKSSFAAIPKTQCPDGERLSSYVQKRLVPDQEVAVREHISGCGDCNLLVRRLRTFERIVRRERLRPWWMAAAASVAVCAALFYPAYRLFASRRMSAAPPVKALASAVPPVQWAQVLQLDAPRSAAAQPIPIAPGGVLTLSFFAPVEAKRRYVASI